MDAKTFADALIRERGIFDRENQIVYSADVSMNENAGELAFFGVNEFHLDCDISKYASEIADAGNIEMFAISYIPAAGAGCGNEFGWCRFNGFGDGKTSPENHRDAIEYYAANVLNEGGEFELVA